MKGFTIYVKNDLLEPKHYNAMKGKSIWLYLWFLDKITVVNEKREGKVLGGKPITFELVQKDLGLDLRSYRRHIKTLTEAGYISTIRTPHGLTIIVTKSKKVFGNSSANNGTSHSKSDSTKVAHQVYKSGTSNIRQDNRQDNINTNVLIGTNVPNKTSPEINLAFDYWNKTIGTPISTRVKLNRNACYNLIRKYGLEGTYKLIDGVALSYDDPYSPRIADFTQLQSKLPDFLLWGRKKIKNNKKGVVL